MTETEWSRAGVTVEPLAGAALADALPELASLRIAVFRAFPYLYDGDLAYEREYLETFSQAAGAVVVIARKDGCAIGASTGAPMSEVEDDWRAPFLAAGHSVERIFYCGESVLLPAYRGLGIGHAFFDWREARANALGLSFSTFCGVIRPKNHPLRPADYVPLDGFWRKRGYAPLEGIRARFSWKDVDCEKETEKALQFWGRSLC